MKSLTQYITESSYTHIELSNKETEQKVRKETRNLIDSGDIKDGSELSEFYHHIFSKAFKVPVNDIRLPRDKDRMLLSVVDDEVEKNGVKPFDWDDSKLKEIQKQLEKLHKIQNS